MGLGRVFDLMRFTSIASGSSGNCTYVGSDNTHILIDAGVSKKRIVVKVGTSTITNESGNIDICPYRVVFKLGIKEAVHAVFGIIFHKMCIDRSICQELSVISSRKVLLFILKAIL